jgi:hypothetical protein
MTGTEALVPALATVFRSRAIEPAIAAVADLLS